MSVAILKFKILSTTVTAACMSVKILISLDASVMNRSLIFTVGGPCLSSDEIGTVHDGHLEKGTVKSLAYGHQFLKLVSAGQKAVTR